ncbi:hypothetical protein PanWU01x14_292880 [Parasponia andersonii]|uniref:Uncharacterized protein n=1 Tax=Parasponia andersonii TaxID=3476 RepID=A0A2P5AWT9_PARAD|nr:hypothetical protein PanWU01x14_292880 [Parasponia andersonii]
MLLIVPQTSFLQDSAFGKHVVCHVAHWVCSFYLLPLCSSAVVLSLVQLSQLCSSHYQVGVIICTKVIVLSIKMILSRKQSEPQGNSITVGRNPVLKPLTRSFAKRMMLKADVALSTTMRPPNLSPISLNTYLFYQSMKGFRLQSIYPK